MLEILTKIHLGLGHLLSVLGLLALLLAIFLAWKNDDGNRLSSIYFKVVVGLIDLQVLLGIINYFSLPGRPEAWHPVLGILGVISFHAGNKMVSWKRVISFLAGMACIIGAVMLVV